MFTIAGVTGHVGSAAAQTLLESGEEVTVLVRDPARAGAWRERATVAQVDLRERDQLAAALRGSDGFFALLPFSPGVEDIDADQNRLVDAIAGAVADSDVPHVVLLSSLGADLDEAPEVIAWLRQLEQRLAGSSAVLTAVRSTHFQEKVTDLLGAATTEGIYPVFASETDKPVPMVASRDVGAVAAQVLQQPPAVSQVIDVLGPAVSEEHVAAVLGAALGRALDVVTVPRDAWTRTLAEAGTPPRAAELLAGLYDAGDRGLLRPAGDRQVEGATPVEETVRAVVRRVAAALG